MINILSAGMWANNELIYNDNNSQLTSIDYMNCEYMLVIVVFVDNELLPIQVKLIHSYLPLYYSHDLSTIPLSSKSFLSYCNNSLT